MMEKQYTAQNLTFTDLKVHFRTGQSFVISGTGKNRIWGYRYKVKTNIGEIEVSEWIHLMYEVINREQEEELFSQLYDWVKKNMKWLHTQKEIEQYALELHACRIFDNPKWCSYIPFNQEYRPNVLRKEKENESND